MLSGAAKNITLNERATSRVKRTAAIFKGRQEKRARQLRVDVPLSGGGWGGFHVVTAGGRVPGNVGDSTMIITRAQVDVEGGGDDARVDPSWARYGTSGCIFGLNTLAAAHQKSQTIWVLAPTVWTTPQSQQRRRCAPDRAALTCVGSPAPARASDDVSRVALPLGVQSQLQAPVQSISGYMRSSYMTCHITGGFSLPEGARERSIQLFADDQVARGHLIGQILQMWQLSQQQSSNLDS